MKPPQFRQGFDSISRARRMSRIESSYCPNERYLHELGEDEEEEQPPPINLSKYLKKKEEK